MRVTDVCVEVAAAVSVGVAGAAAVLNVPVLGNLYKGEEVPPASVATIDTKCPAPELIPVN